MRILIVGAGALGGYYGARLLAAQRDVTFLVRPARAAQLTAEGLHVLSPKGDLHLAAPPILEAGQLNTPYDLILLSCKAYDLAEAMESFAPAVGPAAAERPATAILPLLNGLAHIDALDQRFGRVHVLGGTSNISATRSPDGTIHQLNSLDRLYFGDRDEPDNARMVQIATAFADTNIEAYLRPNILQDLWNKWMIIATIAGSTCLMRAAIADIQNAGALPIAQQLLAECAAIATQEGFPPTGSGLGHANAVLTQPGSLFTASMLRDMEAGAPIEAHQILGDLLAHAGGLPSPTLTIAHAHLRCYEERRKRELSAPPNV